MRVAAGLVAAMLLGQSAAEAPLTDDCLRQWMTGAGLLTANHRLLHEQFAQQRSRMPPWWPSTVADEEEAALQSIDLVTAALPFYAPCFTDPEARLLAKFSSTAMGQKIIGTGLAADESRAVSGSSPIAAHEAQQQASAAKVKELTVQEKLEAVSHLSPAEQAYAAQHFTPARLVVTKACTDRAFAQMLSEVKKQQETVLRAVVERNRPALTAARTAWLKEHPDAR